MGTRTSFDRRSQSRVSTCVDRAARGARDRDTGGRSDRSGGDAEGFVGHGRRGLGRLGSIKRSIGHLIQAAGAAGLMKVVQSVHHRTLPPLANHTGPNPFWTWREVRSPVHSRTVVWYGPARAGVSSFGVGGTNAHVIVEEATRSRRHRRNPGQVLVLSGATKASLDEATERLADFLERPPDLNLADVAHTLITGR